MFLAILLVCMFNAALASSCSGEVATMEKDPTLSRAMGLYYKVRGGSRGRRRAT